MAGHNSVEVASGHFTTTADAPMGPTPAPTVLTAEEEAIAMALRQHTYLPLDDCLYALQETIPHLSRSALHRLFQRHGISQRPAPERTEKKKKCKDYPVGYLHVDFAGVHTEEGRVYLFVAIDRTSKLAFAEWRPRATKMLAADFLRRVQAAIPYKVQADNGTQSGNTPHQVYAWRHLFDRVCDEHGIEHRFTKPAHPWTNGQVERFNRTLKEATVRRYHYRLRPNPTSTCKPFRWLITTPSDSNGYGGKLRTSSSANNGT